MRGEVTVEQLYAYAPAFEKNALAFTPNPEAIERIGRIDDPIDILVFFGTWCPDSIREVPKLLKILESANNPNIQVELHAVDSAIEDGAGFAQEYGVRQVPSIVFLRNGGEVGRIVVHPETTMEDAVLRLASSGQEPLTYRAPPSTPQDSGSLSRSQEAPPRR